MLMGAPHLCFSGKSMDNNVNIISEMEEAVSTTVPVRRASPRSMMVQSLFTTIATTVALLRSRFSTSDFVQLRSAFVGGAQTFGCTRTILPSNLYPKNGGIPCKIVAPFISHLTPPESTRKDLEKRPRFLALTSAVPQTT